jgi:hypothetical protein
MTIKLSRNLTSIKPESPPRFYCFQIKREKYEQNPKIRSFQIKTNKSQRSQVRGLVTHREGVSTQSVLGTPREPFLVCICIFVQMMLVSKYNGGMRKEFINYIFVFDKTFGLVLTYQHKNEGSKPRSSCYQFQSWCIAFNKNLNLKGTKAYKWFEWVNSFWILKILSQV